MKILVINGHKYYPFSEGKLNKTLFDEIIKNLSTRHELKTTIIEQGYSVQEEIEKFKWADTIVMQTPVNWYGVPWLFKKYIDEVYQMKIFYQGSPEYGYGGLFKDKKYMYSLTWGSPKEAFDGTGKFFDGRSADDAFIAMHKTQEYCAVSRIKTFCAYGVLNNPNIESYVKELNEHLNTHLP